MKDLPDNFDINNLKTALGFVTKFRTAVDGGAHKGIWSKYMQDKFEKVISFEPTDYNANRFIANTELRKKALGNRVGKVAMLSGVENTGQWYVGEGDDFDITTLDNENITDLDFLKLDVEGYELFALMGGIKTIEKYKPTILIEQNHLSERYGVPIYGARDFLISLGYVEVARCNKDIIMVYI